MNFVCTQVLNELCVAEPASVCCTERCSCCRVVQRGAAVVILYREVQLLLCCTEKCSCCHVVQRGASVVVLYGEVRLLSCDQGCSTEKENKMINF